MDCSQGSSQGSEFGDIYGYISDSPQELLLLNGK